MTDNDSKQAPTPDDGGGNDIQILPPPVVSSKSMIGPVDGGDTKEEEDDGVAAGGAAALSAASKQITNRKLENKGGEMERAFLSSTMMSNASSTMGGVVKEARQLDAQAVPGPNKAGTTRAAVEAALGVESTKVSSTGVRVSTGSDSDTSEEVEVMIEEQDASQAKSGGGAGEGRTATVILTPDGRIEEAISSTNTTKTTGKEESEGGEPKQKDSANKSEREQEPEQKGSAHVPTAIGTSSAILGPSVGSIFAERSCAHGEHRGTLHLGTRAVCFRSVSFWGYERSRVVIPLATIAAVLNKNADGISVRDECGDTYDFEEVEGRDSTFALLLTLHGRVSVYRKSVRFGKKASVRGMEDTDEAFSAAGEADGLDPQGGDGPVQKQDGAQRGRRRRSVHQSMELRRQSLILASEDQVIDEKGDIDVGVKGTENTLEEGEATETDYFAACAVATVAETDEEERRNLVDEILRGRVSERGRATARRVTDGNDAVLTVEENLEEAWRKLRDGANPPFVEVPIKNLKLHCTLDDFVTMFLANDADHSIALYQRQTGDKDLETSKWCLSEEDGFSLTRTISYVHPVNAPMAPPMAAAVKEQRFRRFGEKGLCIETHTTVRDVPLTDCFYVEDHLLIEPVTEVASPALGEGKEQTGEVNAATAIATTSSTVRLTARFDVRFVKRTMFRTIIAGTTKGEFQTWFRGYRAMIESVLSQVQARAKAAMIEDKEPTHELDAETKKAVEKEDEVVVEKAAATPAVAAVAPVAGAVLPSKIPTEKYLFILVSLVMLLVFFQLVLILSIKATNRTLWELKTEHGKALRLIAQLLESSRGGLE